MYEILYSRDEGKTWEVWPERAPTKERVNEIVFAMADEDPETLFRIWNTAPAQSLADLLGDE